MTDKERLQQIEQRMELLITISKRMEKIIMHMEEMAKVKRPIEPDIKFKSANNNKSRDDELKAREMEIFQMLDNKKE